MAPSFDYAASTLLCAEEDTSIFDDVDSYVNEDDFEICTTWQYTSNRHNNLFNQDQNFNSGVGFSGFVPIQMQSEECLASLFDKETQHLPCLDYLKRLRSGNLDLGARKEAIDRIQKVQSHYNFGPLCLYLAVNYLDRFLSVYELPKDKAWMMQLLAVACLSLAAKMEETEVPFLLDLQVGEAKFVFEAKTIQRMELLVLSTLKWRMQAVTPFAFIDFFLYKINGHQMPAICSILQSIQLILSTIKGIDFLEFRASEIAAAVAISVTQETQFIENPDNPFSFLYEHIHKEKLSKCVELIQDLTQKSGCKSGMGSASTTISSLSSVPQSPNGVLDAATCLSYQTDDANSTPSTSRANSTHNTPAPKKRKLDISTTF